MNIDCLKYRYTVVYFILIILAMIGIASNAYCIKAESIIDNKPIQIRATSVQFRVLLYY